MMNEMVKKSLEDHARTFAHNRPFRHVVIDDFFQPDVVNQLLAEFPRFEQKNALNEMGKVGGKAVVQNLHAISPLYARVADYLASEGFLTLMSQITRIPELYYDNRMFGGGTHENLHGQELDPHVDFNVLDASGLHRRLNIIVYLNREWREEWGGSIELYSDPRNPDNNRVRSFAPVFNRAIIFETNEYSWHGFPRIELPEEYRSYSRKSLSIYLYTKDRPDAEKAPSHGTFYVPRPLPGRFKEGYVFGQNDIQELRRLFRKRDQLLTFHQNKELENGAKYEALHEQFLALKQALTLPLLGYVVQEGAVEGYYHDGSVGREVRTRLRFVRSTRQMTLYGFIPEHLPMPVEVGLQLEAAGDQRKVGEPNEPGKVVREVIRKPGHFSISCECRFEPDDSTSLIITSSQAISGKAAGLNEDAREIAFVLKEIVAE